MPAGIKKVGAVFQRFFNRQPNSTVGIDIGSGSIKVAEVFWRQNKPELTAAGIAKLPVSAVRDSHILNETLLAETLHQVLTMSGVTGKHIVLSLSGQAVVIRELLFPVMNKEELQQAIKWDLDKYVTTANVDEYYFDFAIIGTVQETQEIRVLFVAAPLKLIAGLTNLIKKLGLQPLAIDIEPLALQRTMAQADNSMVIDIGAEFCQLSLFQQGAPVVSRLMPLGGMRYTETIMQVLEVNLYEAERLKQQKNFLAEGSQSNEGLSYVVQQHLRLLVEELAREIRRTADYYQMQNRNALIDKIILTGGGAQLEGLAVNLTQQLTETQVNIHSPLTLLPISPSLDFDWLKGIELQLAVAIGLALRRGGED